MPGRIAVFLGKLRLLLLVRQELRVVLAFFKKLLAIISDEHFVYGNRTLIPSQAILLKPCLELQYIWTILKELFVHWHVLLQNLVSQVGIDIEEAALLENCICLHDRSG